MSNKDQEGFYRGTRRYVVILLAAAPLFALSRFVAAVGTAGRVLHIRFSGMHIYMYIIYINTHTFRKYIFLYSI